MATQFICTGKLHLDRFYAILLSWCLSPVGGPTLYSSICRLPVLFGSRHIMVFRKLLRFQSGHWSNLLCSKESVNPMRQANSSWLTYYCYCITNVMVSYGCLISSAYVQSSQNSSNCIISVTELHPPPMSKKWIYFMKRVYWPISLSLFWVWCRQEFTACLVFFCQHRNSDIDVRDK